MRANKTMVLLYELVQHSYLRESCWVTITMVMILSCQISMEVAQVIRNISVDGGCLGDVSRDDNYIFGKPYFSQIEVSASAIINFRVT